VLLRALEPTHGLDQMRERRGLDDARLLCAGPGRLCQALGITREHDGLPLDQPPFELHERTGEPEIVTGPRIGITRAAERPWRYGLPDSPYLSRKFPRPTSEAMS
jgi:DNA-3-methyladenine glycosylase